MSAREARRRSRALRPLTVEALWAIKRIGVPTLAPDGTRVCAPVTSYDMRTNESRTELCLYATGFGAARSGRAPRRLTAGDKDGDPKWSPDGRHIAFTAKRKDDEEPQLYVIAADGGEARRLTTLAGGAAAPRWFADGKRVAFVSWVWPDLATPAQQAKRRRERAEAKVRAYVTERSDYRFWDRWLTDGREPHVFVCDIATGRTRDALAGTGLSLPPWEPSVEDFDVAPDGRELALTADLAVEPKMRNQTDIVTVNLATRRKRVLTAGSGRSEAHPRYSPDGTALVFRSYDTARAFSDQGRLVVFSRNDARTRVLAPRFDRLATHVAWTPDSRALLFTAEDRGRQGIWRLPIADRGKPALVVAGGTVVGFSHSGDGSVLAFERSTFNHPPALFACRADGGDERPIETENRALLGRHTLGNARELVVRGWRGEPAHAWVVYPPNFDPQRRWPLLQVIHGGPHAAHTDGWHFRWNTQVFAGQGYVVVGVNYHGSSGFGQKALDAITGRYGERELADIEAATDYLLRQGYIDRDRLCAAGGSYGGYLVAYLNGHTDRYKAYVCHAGCYDWGSMMAADDYLCLQEDLGAFPWDNPARVAKQSPHHYMKRAKTPTLVVHGEQDFRVPVTQALQYYDTLRAKGVAARLVYFPDENHWVLKPQNSRLWYREFFAWLAQHAPAKK